MFRPGHACRSWLLIVLVPTLSSWAQSSRPGWGATPYHDATGTGVTFRVWAPNATAVHVPGQFNGWSTTANGLGKELTNGVWNGVWSADVTGVLAGQQYKYFINYTNGSVWRHDPRARKEVSSSTGSGGNDIVYDATTFDWTNDIPATTALNALVIYELHIGTFYDPNSGSGLQGKFTDATNRLDYLKNLGINAVEVMPIAECPGTSSWGYNPADIFAADNAHYGGPDGFKSFVKACHSRGIAVLLDVVHNHYGPTDLDLWDFDGWDGGGLGGGIYFYQSNPDLEITPWGNTRPNFGSEQVRHFVQDNFAMWLSEYHVDGFRWDAASAILYDHAGNFITDAGTLVNAVNDMIHSNYSGNISIAEDIYNSFGFDGTWDTTYPFVVTPVLTNTVDAARDLTALTNALADNQRFGGAAGFNRVIFLEDHDVVGDLNNGVRLVTAIDSATPNSWRARKLSLAGAALTFTAPGVPMLFEGQEMLENQPFSSSRPVDWTKTNTYSGIVRCYHDLIALRRNFDGGVSGLQGSQIHFLQVDNARQTLAYRRWQTNATSQDVVVVANLSGSTNVNYAVSFPRTGNWYVHFNSDSTNYSGDFSNIGTNLVVATGGNPTASLDIGPYSVLVLSQTPPIPALSLSVTNGTAAITWPASYPGWTLESTPGLNPATWSVISNSTYQINGSLITVRQTFSDGSVFYRLSNGQL